MTSPAAGAGWRPAVLAALLACAAGPAEAQAIKNPIAVFSGLDKITGLITSFQVGIDQTKSFHSLEVTPRVCNTRPVTEEPKTTSFVEIDENLLDGRKKRVFTGWMLAESPGLSALEHPVYDVWLIGCRDPNRKEEQEEPDPEAEPDAAEDDAAAAADPE